MSEVNILHTGDCREVLRKYPDNFFDSVVTDPPYGLSKTPDMAEVLSHWLAGDDYEASSGGFMGKTWDSFVPGPAIWKEVFRVLKPGGMLLAFGGTRTFDLLSIAIRLAGFESRDIITWHSGQGFPKSHSIGKGIDKKFGVERKVVGEARMRDLSRHNGEIKGDMLVGKSTGTTSVPVTTANSPEAQLWQSHGTALKPATEFICLAMKPLDGTFVNNALTWGVAGLNIDGTRVGVDGGGTHCNNRDENGQCLGHDNAGRSTSGETIHGPNTNSGRWPANLILECTCDHTEDGAPTSFVRNRTAGARPFNNDGEDTGYTTDEEIEETPVVHTDPECPCYILDAQSGRLKGSKEPSYGLQRRKPKGDDNIYGGGKRLWSARGEIRKGVTFGDDGGASRFFYQAKVSKRERTVNGAVECKHPTLKPLALMKYLCALVSTPTGGIVLDPFAGSGTTCAAAALNGQDYVGIEQDPETAFMARMRIAAFLEDGSFQ